MEAFLVSTGIVALAEIGDKTQLLAFILAAKFRKPLPIIAGIMIATVANHSFAGALGAWIPLALEVLASFSTFTGSSFVPTLVVCELVPVVSGALRRPQRMPLTP